MRVKVGAGSEVVGEVGALFALSVSVFPPSVCLFLYYVYECLPVRMDVHPVCAVSVKARRGHLTPGDNSYRQLRATMWTLATEPKSSERAAKSLTC